MQFGESFVTKKTHGATEWEEFRIGYNRKGNKKRGRERTGSKHTPDLSGGGLCNAEGGVGPPPSRRRARNTAFGCSN